MSSKVKKCKNCEAEIDAKAVVCPSCGVKVKKPFYKKAWFIILAVIIVIGAIASAGGSDSPSNVATNTGDETGVQQNQEIVYEEVKADKLISDLEANALKAENEYLDKYVKLTGRLSVIDSDGKYISLAPVNDPYSFMSVQCYIKNDEQLEKVLNMQVDDTVTLNGKIKSVGEVLGYALDIESIE